MIISFPLPENFLDPQLTKDGKPYGPVRYKEITQECYIISKNMHTSYLDLMRVTPTERRYFLEFLAEEQKKSEDAIKKQMSENKARSR